MNNIDTTLKNMVLLKQAAEFFTLENMVLLKQAAEFFRKDLNE